MRLEGLRWQHPQRQGLGRRVQTEDRKHIGEVQPDRRDCDEVAPPFSFEGPGNDSATASLMDATASSAIGGRGGMMMMMMVVVWAHTCWETEEKNSAPHRAAGRSPRPRERAHGRAGGCGRKRKRGTGTGSL